MKMLISKKFGKYEFSFFVFLLVELFLQLAMYYLSTSALIIYLLLGKQGEALFQTHENLEHLAMMEKVLGPLPQHMVLRAE